MTFFAKGFQTQNSIGTPDGTAGSYRMLHSYATNDDAPTIETANYFDPMIAADINRVKTGDLLLASIDIDGAPLTRLYRFNNDGTHLTVFHETAGLGAGLQILSFFTNLADITATDILKDYKPGFNFRLEALDFIVNKPATTAAKLATLSLKMSDVAVTGGALALTSANCATQGTDNAATAITALNVGGPADTFSVNAALVTAFVEGNGWIVVKLRNLDNG